MLTYRDRSFCSEECGSHDCPRCVTPAVLSGARHMNLPLAYMQFRDTRECLGFTPSGRAALKGDE